MAGEPASALLDAGDLTDCQLLRHFVSGREEGAFAALVRRHGAAVLQACRRALPVEQDAEDVFQATFLALARKAPVVPWRTSVRHWLLAVARRLSLRARCSAARRSPGGEPEDPEPCDRRDGPLAEAARRELRQVLDEELGLLPEKYRAPVVLCYLEGMTNEQAADELGWPAGSMSRRLARARALLRERLTRRGLVPAAVLGLALACLWLLALAPAPGQRPAVAKVMAPFAAGGDRADGFEQVLRRAAAGGMQDRARLERMARHAVLASDDLAGHDPGRDRRDWKDLAEQMRCSAIDLTEALAHNNERTTRKAAGRLLATCQGCHATFRD